MTNPSESTEPVALTGPQDKIVYFIRHGESQDNARPVVQATNTLLSVLGEEQAQAVARRMAGVEFDVLISSTLPRAHQTAEAIAKHTGKQLELEDLFIERVRPREIDGQPYANPQVEATYQQWEQSLRTPGMRVPGGENYDDILARIDRILDYLNQRPENIIVVVTHGFLLRTLIARVLTGENFAPHTLEHFLSRTNINNTAMTTLRYRQSWGEGHEWRLETLNDYTHLGM
jgi:broad specificity phosphatase PhoE